MPTVLEVIRRLFPHGTNRGAEDWDDVPIWPPDAFAVSAYLVERSGCYAHARFTGFEPDSFFDREGYLADVKRLARSWGDAEIEPIQKLWNSLRESDHDEITAIPDNPSSSWWDYALLLMVIADTTCAGMGFATGAFNEATPFNEFYIREQSRLQAQLEAEEAGERPVDDTPPRLPYLEHTLCDCVPPTEVCVQPKTVTAQAGCTLRSLSHHLALLPGWGEVKTYWKVDPAIERRDAAAAASPEPKGVRAWPPLNLLVVPFPYSIDGECFRDGSPCCNSESTGRDDCAANRANFFDLDQAWLNLRGEDLPADPTNRQDALADRFCCFLQKLLEESRRQSGTVHGVILPELALSRDLATSIAKRLADEPGLELFITGFAEPGVAGGLGRNKVYSASFANGKVLRSWSQSKHHRWKLERHQIRRYHLGARLNPRCDWWESIDVSERECVFRVLRGGASFVALVCEDLARIDPVQTVIRAIGPNLVVALLMDGPQLEKRWSGRYATVLADDPGSAVLTLSSLGLIRRASDPGDAQGRQIALWKDASGTAAQLALPQGSHALLLTLSVGLEVNHTMDGRSDGGGTYQLTLSGVQSVAHPDPPDWAKSS